MRYIVIFPLRYIALKVAKMLPSYKERRFSVLPDTAGELSPSAPSPRSGEGWGKNAPGEHYKGRRP